MTFHLDHKGAFNTTMWEDRAKGGADGGYEKLGWVGNNGLLKPFVDLGDFTGREAVVDVGTGSLAVLRTIAPYVGKVIGFDIAAEMIKRGNDSLPINSGIFVGDAYRIPINDNTVNAVTTRMVYHHLPDVKSAVHESRRILKPGGKLIISEYVAADARSLAFDNVAFQIKEAGRHLWTGDLLKNLVSRSSSFSNVDLYFAMLTAYSVRDWMGKSGLSLEKQMKVTDHYRSAPSYERAKMNIQNVGEDNEASRDALVDRPFAFVVATK
jgi:SAM-dependent methyltransferase